MILLAVLAVALLLSLLFGGSFRRLADTHIRWASCILLSLGLQILIFSRWWQETVSVRAIAGALYIASLAILLYVAWLNRRLPGLGMLALGLVMNALVIFANGGSMPASLDALQMSGVVESPAALEAMRSSNSSIIVEGTPLWFLGDVFAIPQRFPLSNVFSLGDVLIGVGAVWFLVANTRPAAPHGNDVAPSGGEQ